MSRPQLEQGGVELSGGKIESRLSSFDCRDCVRLQFIGSTCGSFPAAIKSTVYP